MVIFHSYVSLPEGTFGARAPDLPQTLRQTRLESLEDPVDENGW